MERLILFGILSIPILILSWKSMLSIRNHGLYRFFSWECIVWLFVNNFRYWFTNPFSLTQIFSWVFLIISGYLVIAGVILMKKVGKPNKSRDGKSLYQFEKTSELVDVGIFKYIRHPLYSSLLFLTWGVFLKNPDIILLIVALLSSLSLYLTARCDEKECMQFFGDKYNDYMKCSKMFIPFVF